MQSSKLIKCASLELIERQINDFYKHVAKISPASKIVSKDLFMLKEVKFDTELGGEVTRDVYVIIIDYII